MKRLLTIILAALMMCSLLATAIWADDEGPVEGWGDEDEIIQEEREGLQKVGDVNGAFYRYVGTADKYYYYLYSDVEALIEDGTLHIYGADGEELFLCDEFKIDKQPWIQEVIDAYGGEVEIPMHHVDIVGTFAPTVEYDGNTVTDVPAQTDLTAPEDDEDVPAEDRVDEEPTEPPVEDHVEEEPEDVLIPVEEYDSDSVAETFDGTVYSDEYGDYVVSTPNGYKMYIRLNPETRVTLDENGFVCAYDADGNRLNIEIDLDEHPWIMEPTKESDASVSATDVIDEYIEPTEDNDSNAGAASGTNIGIVVAATLAIFAILAILALIFKKR